MFGSVTLADHSAIISERLALYVLDSLVTSYVRLTCSAGFSCSRQLQILTGAEEITQFELPTY